MKALLIFLILLTTNVSFAKDRILLNFTDESRDEFIKSGIFKKDDFLGRQIEILESTTFDIVSMISHEKYGISDCYEGDIKIAEKIFWKLVGNAETKFNRAFDNKDLKVENLVLLTSLNSNVEGGCGVDGKPKCWNFTVTIPPCKN